MSNITVINCKKRYKTKTVKSVATQGKWRLFLMVSHRGIEPLSTPSESGQESLWHKAFKVFCHTFCHTLDFLIFELRRFYLVRNVPKLYQKTKKKGNDISRSPLPISVYFIVINWVR